MRGWSKVAGSPWLAEIQITIAVKSASMAAYLCGSAGAPFSRWWKRPSLGYAWIYLGNSLVLFAKRQALADLNDLRIKRVSTRRRPPGITVRRCSHRRRAPDF